MYPQKVSAAWVFVLLSQEESNRTPSRGFTDPHSPHTHTHTVLLNVFPPLRVKRTKRMMEPKNRKKRRGERRGERENGMGTFSTHS